jgi:bifunctional DNase/RNase
MKLSRRAVLRLAGTGALLGGAGVWGWRSVRQAGLAQAADDLLPVKVKQVYNDPIGAKVVVLAPEKGEKVLRVWVGEAEALAIAAALNDISFPRPMTHDLFYAALQALKAKVERVVIHDLRDNTFYATLVLRTNEGLKELDARPSDSIALALRAKAPIFLTPKVQAAMEAPGQEEMPPSPPPQRRKGIRA